MRPIIFLPTVLLASAVTVQDTECLPMGPVGARIGPYAKQLIKTARGKGRSFSTSYKGPIMPPTHKEAVALVDAKDGGHKTVTNLRHDGQYSNVHAVVHPQDAKDFQAHQARLTKNRWEKSEEPFMQSQLYAYKGGNNKNLHTAEEYVHSLDDLQKNIRPGTHHVDVYHLAPGHELAAAKVHDGITKSGRPVGAFVSKVDMNTKLHGPEHKKP